MGGLGGLADDGIADEKLDFKTVHIFVYSSKRELAKPILRKKNRLFCSLMKSK